MTDLFQLMNEYGSDKSLVSYTRIYHILFSKLRYNPMNILEIGVGTMDKECRDNFAGNLLLFPNYKPGGSVRAWRDYFENSQVYGIDIGEDCVIEEDRLNTFVCNSMDKEEVDSHFEDDFFDIIVDDGAHLPESQIKTFSNFFPKLKKKGIYCIEDTGSDALWRGEHLINLLGLIPKPRLVFGNMGKNMFFVIK